MNNNNNYISYDAYGSPVYSRAGRVLDYEEDKMYNKFVGPDTFAPSSDAIYRMPMPTPRLDRYTAIQGEYLIIIEIASTHCTSSEAAMLGRHAQSTRNQINPNVNQRE